MKLNIFEFYDYWLLLSIGAGRRGATLEQIMSSGDHYNHAIFTLDELNYGMSKLIENGYVIQKNNRFYCTKKAEGFNRKHYKIWENSISSFLRCAKIFQRENAKQSCELAVYFT